jgi:hypothetical protein
MASQGMKLDEILARLESNEEEKTAEEKLVEGLSGETTEETTEENSDENSKSEDDAKTEEDTDSEKSAETADETDEEGTKTEDDEAILKVAEDMDLQGRLFARSFVDELQKIAVGDGPYTGNSADINKSVNHLPTGELPEAGKVDVVISKLQQLTGATEASQPSFEVGGDSQPAPQKAPDEALGSVAADANLAAQHAAALPLSAGGQEKTASDVVGTIYNHFFPTEEAE